MVSIEIRKDKELVVDSKVKNKMSLLDHLVFILVGIIVVFLTLFPLTEICR